MAQSQKARAPRRIREARRVERRLLGILLAAFAVAGATFWWLAPSESQKPTITMYMPDDCVSCGRYVAYLRSHGFRVEAGNAAELDHIRLQFRLPRSFRSRQTGVVQGLYVEGPVPAADIRKMLEHNRGVLGVVVPGAPEGAPGIDSALPVPFTVYLVRSAGLMQPLHTYNHPMHY